MSNLTLQVKKADGSTASLEVEAGAASVLNPLGFNAKSIAVGDVVTIVGNPARAKPECADARQGFSTRQTGPTIR
jgi:hypothetical protein